MRVVIAEDQVLLRDGLVRMLRDAGHQVLAHVGDAGSLVDEVNRHRPDLVVSDVRMPPAYADEGARAVRALRDRFPALAAVMLTQVVDPALVATLSSGRVAGFGYLLKDRVLDTADFLDQLERVAAGGTAIDPAVVAGFVRRAEGRTTGLTEREVEVLSRVASGRSNAGIAADLVISRRTVDAHLRAIFAKLDLGAEPEDNQRVLAVLRWLAEHGPVGGGIPDGGAAGNPLGPVGGRR